MDNELIQSTNDFLQRASERAIEDRREELEQNQIIREQAAFSGGWVPGNPTDAQRQEWREDYVRRQERNGVINSGGSDRTERELLVSQTINEAHENGDLSVATDEKTVVADETNEVIAKPTDNEIKSAMATRSVLEMERQNILAEAQTPHEVGLDGALKSYVNGRADAYNNIRNALAESSAVELPNVIEPEEINVAPPTLAIDDRQQSLQLAL